MRILIVYATREGQSRRIAMRLADDLVSRGGRVDIYDARSIGDVSWGKYSTACLVASVHGGRHEAEMVKFVTQHRVQLERLTTAFVSVSLSEATVEDQTRTEAERRQAAADVQRMIDDFVTATGWRPARTLAVAGALAYRKYNILIRFVMKRIARKAGGPTDTSRDHDLTNWPAVDRFADELAGAKT